MPATFQQNLIPFLMNLPLFNGVSESALQELVPHFEVLAYDPGSMVFREEDLSNDLYILFEGEVSLIKEVDGKGRRYAIAKLGMGEVFGEMSFIDDSPRSCSVETYHPLILIKLPRRESREFSAHLQETYEKIVRNIASIVIRRMRTTNDKFAKGKDVEIRKLQIQNGFTTLLLNAIMGIIVASGVCGALYLSGAQASTFNLINFLAVLAVFAIVLDFAYRHNYSWQNFGLQFENGISFIGKLISVASLSVLAVGVSIYALSYVQNAIPKEYAISIPFMLTYPVFVLFAELVLRGTVQSLMLKLPFCDSKWFAVLYTALLVASCNGYFGFQSAAIVFALNVLCGTVYLYSKNIFMPAVLHLILGLSLKYGGLLPFAFMT